jgi:hypothetical protein
VWALRKVANLLSSVPFGKRLEILESVRGENTGNQWLINEDNQCAIIGDNQCKANVTRRYVCQRWPRLRIAGKVRFRNGIFETADPELIALVEANIAYGAQILPVGHALKVELKPT